MQVCEPAVDLIDRKSLRIKIVAQPFQQLLVLVVLRIADRFQKVVETWQASTVFGRTMTLATQAERVCMSRFGREYFLDDNRMFPGVAEVVGVHCLRAGLAEYAEQPHGPLVVNR